MSLIHLTCELLHGAILSGCQQLMHQRMMLNRINVFPVADGDTGDNLASTASAILTFSATKHSIDETLQSIADASVIGARGNSGIIFSEFFNALASNPIQKTELDKYDFSMLLTQAATNVRKSLASPQDGTMLTIIEAWADNVKTSINASVFFSDIMKNLLPTMENTVTDTTRMLPALQKAKVVDAGALGFYHFIFGFTEFILNPHYSHTSTGSLTETTPHEEHHLDALDHAPSHRYCTEAILQSATLDKTRLVELLQQHGDSVVVTGNERLCRFHLHTKKPSVVFNRLLDYGTIQYPKVDDMQRQFEVMHQRKHSIALVTDSSADIPMFLQDNYQIHQIPINLHMDDHHLLDRHSFDPDIFYHELAELKNYPKTSSPSPALIEDKLRYLSHHYEHVIVISIAKAMSGTFDTITKSAKNHDNITVIDSRTTSGAHGLLLDYAGELIERGEHISTIITKINDAIALTKLFVSVEQFDSMIRSGRVNKLTGSIAQFTKIKPIVSIDANGRGTVVSSTFMKSNPQAKLTTMVEKLIDRTNGKLERYAIVHAGVKAKAEAFAKTTTDIFGQAPLYIESASPAIGLHAGHGCIGLAVRISQ